MLSSILDSVKEEGYRKSFPRVRGVDKYKAKGVFRFNEGDKYKEGG